MADFGNDVAGREAIRYIAFRVEQVDAVKVVVEEVVALLSCERPEPESTNAAEVCEQLRYLAVVVSRGLCRVVDSQPVKHIVFRLVRVA